MIPREAILVLLIYCVLSHPHRNRESLDDQRKVLGSYIKL